jgi:hypothetical protein
MVVSHIVGLSFLPVSVLMYLNAFGITKLQKIFGIDLMLIASIGIIVIEIADILGSHLKDEHVVVSWIVCSLLSFPAILYFLSLVITIPAQVLNALPLIAASFLFVEGLSSMYIG